MSIPGSEISAPKMKEGFVNVLNKILNDQNTSLECVNTPLLSRAKSKKSTNELLARHLKRRNQLLEKKNRAQSARKKPNILDYPRERKFQHLATKGIVQLFNAVNKEQRSMSKKLDLVKTDAKRTKVIKTFDKSGFLDSLLCENRKNVGEIQKEGSDSELQSGNSECMESSGEYYSDCSLGVN